MKVNIRGKEFMFKWAHSNNRETVDEFGLTPKSFTRCWVESPHVNKEVAVVLKKGENFSYDKGRKYSLAKLIKEIGFEKSVKQDIWDEYFAMTRKPQFIKNDKKKQEVKEILKKEFQEIVLKGGNVQSISSSLGQPG